MKKKLTILGLAFALSIALATALVFAVNPFSKTKAFATGEAPITNLTTTWGIADASNPPTVSDYRSAMLDSSFKYFDYDDSYAPAEFNATDAVKFYTSGKVLMNESDTIGVGTYYVVFNLPSDATHTAFVTDAIDDDPVLITIKQELDTSLSASELTSVYGAAKSYTGVLEAKTWATGALAGKVGASISFVDNNEDPIAEPTAAGTYNLRITLTDEDSSGDYANYMPTNSKYTYTITQKEVGLNWTAPADLVY